jgi:uncharacterized protein (DUF2252 family)
MAIRQTASKTNRIFKSYAELYAEGKSLRESCPRTSHAEWKATENRPDPLFLLKESSKGRIPELLPIRYGRMLQSPFTFYRGAALNMAADLAVTPTTGLRVQACGDAHLCNFGMYATPERRVIFDINDLDETLRAFWEWDLKRLVASFVLACRSNGFQKSVARDVALSCVRSYRLSMAEFSQMRTLEVWYASTEVETMIAAIKDKEAKRRFQKRLAEARTKTVFEDLYPKLAGAKGTTPTIKDAPPLIYHGHEYKHKAFVKVFWQAFAAYRESLPPDRRILLDRFKPTDIAFKVVGVGSVGTACAILLLMANEKDPLFLQIKEAGRSVLEPYAGKSEYPNHGQRVVMGCQLMQSASDVFLGWTVGRSGRHFYLRQLKDVKIKLLVEVFTPGVMEQYGELCGRTLASAHARSGEAVKVAGYMGKADTFDRAIADFSVAYANQSERDHDILKKAVRAGKLEVANEG